MKRLILIASFATPLLAALPFMLHWTALPEPMASHWGLSGAPDSALPRIAVFALHSGVGLFAAIIAVRAIYMPSEEKSPVLGVASFLGCMFIALGFLVVHANVDVPAWQDARSISLVSVLGVMGLSTFVAALVSRATRVLDSAPSQKAVVLSAGITPNERAVYLKRTKARGMSIMAAALISIALLALVMRKEEIALTLSAIALVMIPFTQIRVHIDRQRIAIEYGPLAFPKQSIALARIERANVIEVRPLLHGGWGYRGSLTIFGRAAVVLRSGSALELFLRDGRRFVVTCDDAERAAGVVNDPVVNFSQPI
jgi:hypothetical protein